MSEVKEHHAKVTEVGHNFDFNSTTKNLLKLFIKSQLKPKPEFIEYRLGIWNELMAKYKDELAAKETKPIKVTLPDGKVMEGESWRTTPLQIAEKIRLINHLKISSQHD